MNAGFSQQKLSVAGSWKFQLDPDKKGEKDKWYQKQFTDNILLPGTTDEGKKEQKPKVPIMVFCQEHINTLALHGTVAR
ncbi:hypothetical protein [Pedobacter steynii]